MAVVHLRMSWSCTHPSARARERVRRIKQELASRALQMLARQRRYLAMKQVHAKVGGRVLCLSVLRGHGVLKGLWSACSACQAKLISGIPKARELVVRMVLSKDYGGTMAAAVAFGVAALTAGLGVWYRCIGGGRQDAACAVHRAAGDKMCRVRVPQLCACTLSRRRRHHSPCLGLQANQGRVAPVPAAHRRHIDTELQRHRRGTGHRWPPRI